MITALSRFRVVLILIFLSRAIVVARAGEEPNGWKPVEAAKYLDEREKTWFGGAKCISCHTVLPYALARPALRGLIGEKTPAEQETKLLAQIRRRVANWSKLDTPEFGLYYDDSEQKKTQSWGTEAIFNSLILAIDDRDQNRSSPSPATKQAFAYMWETQARTGAHKGSWEWLDFSEAPWGNTEARYFGAALAAIAVGEARGYDAPPAGVKWLQEYLKNRLPAQNSHNRAWALWASTRLAGILTEGQRLEVIEELLAKQRADGGWSMPALGAWTRNDGTAQDTTSDGYATGLVLCVLQTAGLPRNNPTVAKGLVWLKRNQTATGAWRGVSVVKKRNPSSHVGKFMSDAATAFAVLALAEPSRTSTVDASGVPAVIPIRDGHDPAASSRGFSD